MVIQLALGLSMYMEILFPRSNFVLDTAAHLWFVFCMYHFFHLTLSYFGGESEYVASLNGIVLPWRGIPCCFWPCVWPFLPKSPSRIILFNYFGSQKEAGKNSQIFHSTTYFHPSSIFNHPFCTSHRSNILRTKHTNHTV
ncbi:hypothetical protein Avbf_07756 [Armadillidium vulgare]|nr:hypothetical protein Avbf_07756 [Armadillidium vulgare]